MPGRKALPDRAGKLLGRPPSFQYEMFAAGDRGEAVLPEKGRFCLQDWHLGLAMNVFPQFADNFRKRKVNCDVVSAGKETRHRSGVSRKLPVRPVN